MNLGFDDFYEPSYLTEANYTGKISTGIQSSFGVAYNLSEKINIFTEFTWVDVRYTIKKATILRYEEDGVDIMLDLENSVNDMDEKVNFSHMGVNFGLKYTFGNK